MPDPFAHCEALVREGDKDRFLATLFAPEKYRRPLHALYAFDLEIGRVRDLAREPMPGEIRLQWWRDALLGNASGDAGGHPVIAALREVVVRYRLPPAALSDMIDARSFDLYDEPMPTVAALETYAAQTAALPLELASRILRDGRDSGATELVAHAGVAVAISRLLRMLPVHSGRGQLYVPAEVLVRHGASGEDILARRTTPELREALADLRLQARGHLDSAGELIAQAPEAIMPALLPLATVRPLLKRMERGSYRPFDPPELPQWRRQWAQWRAARKPSRIAG